MIDQGDGERAKVEMSIEPTVDGGWGLHLVDQVASAGASTRARPTCGSRSGRAPQALTQVRRSRSATSSALRSACLLGVGEFVLGLALALFLAALATHRGVVREVAGGLLDAACDLVRDAHTLWPTRPVRSSRKDVLRRDRQQAAVRRVGVRIAGSAGPQHRVLRPVGGRAPSAGGVGPKSTTDGVPNAVARCATPVSPQSDAAGVRRRSRRGRAGPSRPRAPRRWRRARDRVRELALVRRCR